MTRFRAPDRSHSPARMVAVVASTALTLLLAGGGGALAASHAPATDASSAADAPKPSVPMPSAPMPGTGEAVERGDLRIEDAWTRQPPPGARAGGGYLRITNRGTRPDRLVEGTAPFADAIEIHSMSVVDGIMRMAEIEGGLVIAPGETAELMPGGNHVMMIGLAPDALREGTAATVRLRFERAGEVEVTMPVAPIGARGPGGKGAMGHGMTMEHGATMDGTMDGMAPSDAGATETN